MHLFNVYVQVNKDAAEEASKGEQEVTNDRAKAIFKKMEEGDEETLKVWRRFRDLSIKSYEQVYARLNVHFDVYAGESLVEAPRIRAAIEQLKEKNLLTTKTSKESRPDWDKRREEMKEATGGQETEPPVGEEDEGGAGLALAVDLSKWKMGKPVVQKAGESVMVYCYRNQTNMNIIISFRWHDDLHCPRHCWRHPTL
jgi:arginyl-tRNA synthetase